MSRSLTVYAVSLEALRSTANGSSTLEAPLAAALSDDARAALHALRRGGETDPAAVIWALEELCQALGDALPNSSVSPLRGGVIPRVDDVLTHAGVPSAFRLLNLSYRGAPIPNVGRPPDFPSMGYVEPEAVVEAVAHFAATPPASEDETVDGILAEMEDWFRLLRRLESRAATPLGLVCFLD